MLTDINFRPLTIKKIQMKVTEKKDYKGRQILIGIDVHNNSWEARFALDAVNMKKVRFEKPFVKNLVNYAEKTYPNAQFICAYEAGFSGFWAKRELEKCGFETLVVNPSDIPTSGKDRVFKTDKRDARKIVAGLRSGELEGIHCPTVIEERDRSLIRARRQVAKVERQSKNRIKSALHFLGIDIPQEMIGAKSSVKWTKRFIEWLKEIEEQENLSSLKHQLSILEVIKKEHASILKSLRQLSREERHVTVCKTLETTPGVGPLTSIKLKLELITMDRFSNTDKLLAYIGFVPTTNQSGESQRVGKMTNRGRSELRKTLIETAWIAIKHDPELAVKYEEWKKQKSANKAIVKIAVKLVRRIRHIWIHNEPYRIAEV